MITPENEERSEYMTDYYAIWRTRYGVKHWSGPFAAAEHAKMQLRIAHDTSGGSRVLATVQETPAERREADILITQPPVSGAVTEVITWDWKEAMPATRIHAAVQAIESANLTVKSMRYADTGSDMYCLVISSSELTEREVEEAYERYMSGF